MFQYHRFLGRIGRTINSTGLRVRECQIGVLGCSFTFCDVKIEEVAVEDGLNTAGDNHDDVKVVLVLVAVDPVGDVEAAVDTESEEIVAGDSLRLAGFAEHEELRQDGNGLQIDGKRPQNLKQCAHSLINVRLKKICRKNQSQPKSNTGVNMRTTEIAVWCRVTGLFAPQTSRPLGYSPQLGRFALKSRRPQGNSLSGQLTHMTTRPHPQTIRSMFNILWI